MNYDYDGPRPAHLVLSAVSQNGAIHGYLPTRMALPRGKNRRIDIALLRPDDDLEQSTDLLYVAVITDKGLIYSSHLPLPIRWPAVTTTAKDDYDTHQRHEAQGAWINSDASCWASGDFNCLESAFTRAKDGRTENAYGISVLATLDDSLRRWMHQDTEAVASNKLRQWKAKFPGSQAQALAEAIYRQQDARSALGCCGLQRSDPDAIKLAIENQTKAEQALLAVPVGVRSALWYALYLRTLGALHKNPDAIKPAFNMAQALYPNDISIYIAMAQNHLVQNPHAWVAVEALAQQAKASAETSGEITSGKTSGDTSAGVLQYARFYLALAHKYPAAITDETFVAWPLMKRGLNEMARRYPLAHSDNIAAIWACSAGDKEMYTAFRRRIEGRIIPGLWPDNQSLDLCDHRFAYHQGGKA